jgi:uncharacterized protein YbjT (DUF2867 family)
MEPNKNLRVLVYGATGSQASPVITELQKGGHTPVAVTQSQQKAEVLRSRGVEAVVATMANAVDIETITKNVDVVSLLIPFFIPNPADGVNYARYAIDAAKRNNVRLIIWNASGLIPERPTGNPAIDIRIEIAELLKRSGTPYMILQPGIYAENLFGPWTAPFVRDTNELRYPLPEAVKVGWLSAHDVAKLIVAAIGNPSLAGSNFTISGLENLTGPELAHEFSEGLQRSIRYKPMNPVEFGAILDRTFGPGAGEKAEREYQRMWDTGRFPPTHFDMSSVLNQLPVTMTPIRNWVAQHAAMFTKR